MPGPRDASANPKLIIDDDGEILGSFTKGGLTLADGASVTVDDSAISGASPVLTMTNTTAEDGNGGRESIIDFKGTQSGAEVTTLARIQAQHDGASDDQKGDLILYTNDGSDSNSPSERLRIDSAGNFTFTDSANGVGVIVDASGGTGIIGSIDLKSDRPSNGQDAGRLRFYNNGATPIAQISTARGSSDTTGDMYFNTGNTERLRIHEEGYVDANVGVGIRNKISTADVSNPPTDAELDAEFGTPATVGTGFTALVDDAGGGSNFYIVASDGTNWWQAAMTKAA